MPPRALQFPNPREHLRPTPLKKSPEFEIEKATVSPPLDILHDRSGKL